jgi:hypothetical protein
MVKDSKDFKEGCLICGKSLVYGQENRDLSCSICGAEESGTVACEDGHFVCDSCHSLSGNDFIEKYCRSTGSKDPLAIAIAVMRNRSIKMHGPEHHFLVPAVLVAAYYNSRGDLAAKEKKLAIARKRADKVSGGFCGFQGTCGAAIGTGIFMSTILEATPLSVDEWRLANLLASRSLEQIANHGGPRCCKRNTFLAIRETARFLEEFLDTRLGISENIVCEFSPLNRECRYSDCPFFGAPG